MALSSGITIVDEIIKKLNDCAIGALKIVVKGEQLAVTDTAPAQDFGSLANSINGWTSTTQACYIIIKSRPDKLRKAHGESLSPGLTLIQFIPDMAPVREKTMCSSSKSVLVKALPVETNELWTVFATKVDECSFNGLVAFMESELSPTPFTDKEKETATRLLEEASSGIGLSSRASNASGLNFQMTAEAADAIAHLAKTANSLVGLSIKDERTTFSFQKDGVAVSNLTSATPANIPLFLFLNNGSEIIFAYGTISLLI
jgi:hypothetical protein